MRDASAELSAALLGSFDYRWYADLTYGGARVIEDLPISQPRFKEDGNAKIQQSGSCTVTWTDELATSLVPRYVNDPLAPFGAQLWVSCVVSAGPFEERVAFARYEITDVPDARDRAMRFHSQWLTLGSEVELELKELTAVLDVETFDVPTSAPSLASAWSEIARVSGMPISRAVPDQAISRSVLYDGKKLDVLYELADVILDAVPHMTPSGALACRPNTWPAVRARLTRADHIVSVGQMMSAAGVYNRVVVRATSGQQSSVLSVSEVLDGPLRVANPDGSRSPWGRRTKYLSSEYVTTPTQAQAWGNSTLAQVSTPRAQVVPVVEIFNPLRERGDVVLIERPEVWMLGRVVTVERDDGPTQKLTAEIGAITPK
jgi:hypothetical protein